MRTLLIDADIVAYQFASKSQQKFDWGDGQVSTWVEDLDAVTPLVTNKLEELQAQLEADSFVICLSCPSEDGWRRKILPSYKAHRSESDIPVLREPLKDWMRATYQVKEKPTLEADDVMGILSTHPKLIPGEKIIVSIDKDMKTIPGWLFNPDKDRRPRLISEAEADYWHLYQALVGDPTDGYKGCPGIGPKKAERILDSPPGCDWAAVLAAYLARGLTEEDALLQARVARICRHTDYDLKRKEVKLWNPTQY